MNYKNLALKYLKAFESKNIDLIQEIFSNKIKLIDWEVDLEGKENVINKIKMIFDSIEVIDVKIVELYQEEKTVISKMSINLDNIKLSVVDILKFSEEGKLLEINAFKG